MSMDLVLRVYAAAAIYKWILQDLESEPASGEIQPSNQRPGLFDQRNQGLINKLRIVDRVEYIKTVAKASVPARQVEYQRRLYDIFVNLTTVPVRVSLASPQTADTGSRDAEDIIGRNGWEDLINKAFGKAIELKLDLEKSSREYEFEFPKLGEGFDSEWMIPAHTVQDAVPQGSKVYVCLRPAVFSVSRDSTGEDRVLVVLALVMVEGFGVDWTLF